MLTETGPCEEIAREGSQDVTLEEYKPEEEVIDITDIIDEPVTPIKVIVSGTIMRLEWSEMPEDCYVAYFCEETGQHVVSDEGRETPIKFKKGDTNVTIEIYDVTVTIVVILVPTNVTTPASKLKSGFRVWVCGEF